MYMIENIDINKIIFTNIDNKVLTIDKEKIERIFESWYTEENKNRDNTYSIVIKIKYATLSGIIRNKEISDYFNNDIQSIMTNPISVNMFGDAQRLGEVKLEFKKVMIYGVNRSKNILELQLINKSLLKDNNKEEE